MLAPDKGTYQGQPVRGVGDHEGMSELRLLPDLPPAVPGVWPAPVAVDAAALEAAELQLLSRAVGDHLPVEIQAQVEQLRAQRAALGGIAR